MRRRAGPALAWAGAALALLLAGPAPGAGQTATLQGEAREIARVWQAGDARALAGRMSPDGIRLELPDASHPALSVRLARAALADLHGGAGEGAVTVRQVRPLGGTPPRGFVELTWRPTAAGMTEAGDYTVFAGLEERGGRWWIVEIRVFPGR